MKAGARRGRRRHVDPPTATTEEVAAWFAGNLPDDWFVEPVDVQVDRDEIIVTGTLAVPKTADDEHESTAADARISAFRENTREQRIAIAQRAQDTYLRKVSWAARCGSRQHAFTTASVPVMTRLHMEERATLDTLIDAGVARSRSEALAWTVRLVADNEAEWIESLRAAMTDLGEVRNAGPASRR